MIADKLVNNSGVCDFKKGRYKHLFSKMKCSLDFLQM